MARKDKRQIQTENKKRHLQRISTKKNELGSRVEVSIERQSPSISEKKSFLIICEGKNTEPSYFNKFKLATVNIKVLGHGYNTVSLVKKTIELVRKDQENEIIYDEVWCVFDKDDFPKKDFNDAIILAEENEFKVAYSNQSFEYWIFLHFNDHQGGKLNRKLCCEKLNAEIKKFSLKYEDQGSKNIEQKLFDLMYAKEKANDKERRVEKAIKRAQKIYDALDHQNPADEESSTKLHLLVAEILQYA